MSCPYTSIELAPGFYAIEEDGVRCFLLEGKVQWGNQSIINYRNKCEVAPVTSVIDEAMEVLRVYLMFIDR